MASDKMWREGVRRGVAGNENERERGRRRGYDEAL